MPLTTSATTPSIGGLGLRMFRRQAARAPWSRLFRARRRKCARGISGRRPTTVASPSSAAERLTSMRKPASEKRAPVFLTTEWMTSWSPRSTRTLVTDFAERPAPRDRQEVLLTLGAGADQEVALIEPIRQSQHRAGDVDIVVERQHMDDVRRRIGDRRQALGQFGAGLVLDGVDQPRHDIVEDADLLFGIALGVVDEEIGDAGENIDPAGNAPRGQRGFELVEEGKATHHNSGRRNAVESRRTMH